MIGHRAGQVTGEDQESVYLREPGVLDRDGLEDEALPLFDELELRARVEEVPAPDVLRNHDSAGLIDSQRSSCHDGMVDGSG